MELSIIQALELVPEVNQIMDDLKITSDASVKALRSATELHEEGELKLSSIRVGRLEKILKAQAEVTQDLRKLLNDMKLRVTKSTGSTRSMKKPKSWNSLGDDWWIERGEQMDKWIQRIQTQLTTATTQKQATYEEYITEVVEVNMKVINTWGEFIQYIDEWKDIGILVWKGIGEKKSYIL